MALQEYKVRDPSGAIRTIRGPAGASDADVIAQAQRLFGSAKPTLDPKAEMPFEAEARKTLAVSPAELIAGSAPVRYAMGAAAPIMGVAQLAEKAMGGSAVTDSLKAVEDMKRRGMEAYGQEGTDWMGVMGNVMSPAALAAMKLPVAATVGGRAAQGSAVGAGFGAATPVTEGDNFAGSKAAQIATGATIGAVIPPVIDAGKAVLTAGRNLIDPWLPGGIDRAVGRTANQAAGSNRDAVIEALEQNREIVPGSRPTAAQASSEAGSAEFAGLQRATEYRRPSEYVAREAEQEAARLAAVQGVGKDKAALADAVKNRNQTAGEMYGAVRGDRIGPESNAQIMERAIRERAASKAGALQEEGKFATTAAQQDELAANFVPVPGQPRVAGRVSANAERVPEAKAAAGDAAGVASLRRQEEEFLESTMGLLRDTVGMESRSMTDLMRRPSMRSAVQDAIKSAQERGTYFPRKSGEKFTVENLQRIKESLDAGIRAAKSSADAGKRPELSPAELEGTKKAFVEWLSSRSPGWKQARLQYAEDSVPINRMEVGQELEKALTSSLGAERPAAFSTAVRESARTIKRSTGQPRYESLDEVLAPDQVRAVTNVVDDLKRDQVTNRLAEAGLPAARDMLGQMMPKVPASGMFNPKYSVMRAIVNRLEGRVAGKGIERLSEVMQNPEEMAALMKAATPTERAALVEALLAQKVGRAATVYGTMGASNKEQF